MDPLTIVGLVNASLTLVQQLVPQVQAMAQKGEITPAQQQEIMDKFEAFKASGNSMFQDPAWQPSNRK